MIINLSAKEADNAIERVNTMSDKEILDIYFEYPSHMLKVESLI